MDYENVKVPMTNDRAHAWQNERMNGALGLKYNSNFQREVYLLKSKLSQIMNFS